MSQAQRRRDVRREYQADGGLSAPDDRKKQLGRCVNISHGGILVRSDPVPEFGAMLTLLISLPDLPEACEIPCIVRWNNPQKETVGLQFKSLRPIEVWGLNRLMHRLDPVEQTGGSKEPE